MPRLCSKLLDETQPFISASFSIVTRVAAAGAGAAAVAAVCVPPLLLLSACRGALSTTPGGWELASGEGALLLCVAERGGHTWMESSERLDDLVARARALFERKHGEAEGCFAAFSPAKVVSETQRLPMA